MTGALYLVPTPLDHGCDTLAPLDEALPLGTVKSQIRRALKPDGLLLAAMLGGDTLGNFIALNPQWTAPLATDIAGAYSAESIIAGMQVEAGAELASIAAASAETASVLAGSVAAAAETGTITATIALEAASVAAEAAAAAAARRRRPWWPL